MKTNLTTSKLIGLKDGKKQNSLALQKSQLATTGPNEQTSFLKAKEVIKILHKLGFRKVRQKGSHAFFSHPSGKTTVVPIHQSRSLGKGILHAILHDIQISPEKFNKLK